MIQQSITKPKSAVLGSLKHIRQPYLYIIMVGSTNLALILIHCCVFVTYFGINFFLIVDF